MLRKILKVMPELSKADLSVMKRGLTGPARTERRKDIVDHLISIGKLDKIVRRRERGQARKNVQ